MTIQTQEKQASRLVPLLNLISGVLEERTSSTLTQEDADLLTRSDADLLTLAMMQRLAFRAIAQPYDNGTVQTPHINADFSER